MMTKTIASHNESLCSNFHSHHRANTLWPMKHGEFRLPVYKCRVTPQITTTEQPERYATAPESHSLWPGRRYKAASHERVVIHANVRCGVTQSGLVFPPSSPRHSESLTSSQIMLLFSSLILPQIYRAYGTTRR